MYLIVKSNVVHTYLGNKNFSSKQFIDILSQIKELSGTVKLVIDFARYINKAILVCSGSNDGSHISKEILTSLDR